MCRSRPGGGRCLPRRAGRQAGRAEAARSEECPCPGLEHRGHPLADNHTLAGRISATDGFLDRHLGGFLAGGWSVPKVDGSCRSRFRVSSALGQKANDLARQMQLGGSGDHPPSSPGRLGSGPAAIRRAGQFRARAGRLPALSYARKEVWPRGAKSLCCWRTSTQPICEGNNRWLPETSRATELVCANCDSVCATT